MNLTLGLPSQGYDPASGLAMATFPLPTLSSITRSLPCVSLFHLLLPEANPLQGPHSIEDYSWRQTHSRGLSPRKSPEVALLMVLIADAPSRPVTYRNLGLQATRALNPVSPTPPTWHSTIWKSGFCLLSWSLALLVLHWMTSWDLVLMARDWSHAGKVGLALFSFLVYFLVRLISLQ